MFRVALELTEPPIQRVPGALPQGQSGRGVKLASHRYLVHKLKPVNHLCINLQGVDSDKLTSTL